MRLRACRQGLTFAVRHTIDEEGIRYLYIRRRKEDALVVPYIISCILWGASHNVQTWLRTILG